MKCTVIEINTKTNEIDMFGCKTKKDALNYIKQRKAEMDEKDNKIYEFGINKGWEEN